ncbi:MAG: HNH endonuclease signature motif containing protein [Umezawaea sp.]
MTRWPRKEFLCRAHAAVHFKAKRREDLARLRTLYGDFTERLAQTEAHHVALAAITLDGIDADHPARPDVVRLLAAVARTSVRYFAEFDDQAFRAFGSTRDRSRAHGHKTRAAERNAHAVPVDVAWLRRAYRDRCVYCGSRSEHIDHLWPLVDGGDDAPWNLAPSCASCNLSKGPRSLGAWLPGHLVALDVDHRRGVGDLWDQLTAAG